jgi:hypothetical protein
MPTPELSLVDRTSMGFWLEATNKQVLFPIFFKNNIGRLFRLSHRKLEIEVDKVNSTGLLLCVRRPRAVIYIRRTTKPRYILTLIHSMLESELSLAHYHRTPPLSSKTINPPNA